MQGDDDFEPFFGLIAATVEKSQREKQVHSQENSCIAQVSSGEDSEEDRTSSSSATTESEKSEESREWMFTGIWHFKNTYGVLPNEIIHGIECVRMDLDAFENMWEQMGAELKSAFLKMLPVKPEYIVVVSGLEHLSMSETNDLELQIRGYIAAKRTSREAWQSFGQRDKFEWTKVTGGIRAWPQFLADRRSVLDDHGNLTVLTEWGSRKFFDVHGYSWAFTGWLTVPQLKKQRETSGSDSDVLQMIRDAFVDLMGDRPDNCIRYLCVHCEISTSMDEAEEGEDGPQIQIRGFLQTTFSRMSRLEGWLPVEWRPVRGGLGGNKEFERAEMEARSDDSPWVLLLVEGTLGRNNALKMADTKQASAVRLSVV